MKLGKQSAVLLTAVAVLAAAVMIVLSLRESPAVPEESPAKASPPAAKRKKSVSPVAYSNVIARARREEKPKAVKRPKFKPIIDFREIKPEDSDFIDRLRKMAEEEDRDGLLALAERMIGHAEPDVREEYLKAVGSFGTAALPEITFFLDDADENVSCEARAQWLDAMFRIEDQVEKANVICSAMCSVRNSEFIDQIADELRGLDAELVNEAVEIVLEGGTPNGIAAAKKIAEERSETE